jgi:CubicO group peptidase (beta-lactamase class C family)
MRILHYSLTVTLTLCVAAAAATPDPVRAGMDPHSLREIAGRLQAMTETGEIAGAVWLVQRHGILADVGAVGYADIESRKPMQSDTLFSIQSLGKPIVAVSVMLLVDEGKIALDDPVEQYLPDFTSMWLIESREGDQRRVLKRPSRPPTIRDLLAHTAGLNLVGRSAPPALQGNLLTQRTLSEYVTVVSQQPLDYDPGSKAMYDSEGYFTLARLVEVVSKMPVEEFMEARLYRPLGMKDTCYACSDRTADIKARLASSYFLKDGKLLKNPSDHTSWSLPTAFSTIVDLASFCQMMLNQGVLDGKRIISGPRVREMTRVQRPDLPVYAQSSEWSGYRFGLGWWMVYSPEKGLAGFSAGSFGGQGAGGPDAWVDSGKDLFWVLLLQGGNSDKARATVREAVLGAAK